MMENNNNENLKGYLDLKLEEGLSFLGKKEDRIFKFFAVLFAIIGTFQIAKWVYDYYSFGKFVFFAFIVLLAFVIRKGMSEHESSSKAFSFIYRYKDQIFYGSFVVFFLSLLSYYFHSGEKTLQYFTYFVFFSYIIAKVLGFQLKISDRKLKFWSTTSLQVVIITSSFLYMASYFLLEQYKVGDWENMIYIGIFTSYLISYAMIFTDVGDICREKILAIKDGKNLKDPERTVRRARRGFSVSRLLLGNLYMVLMFVTASAFVGYMYFNSDPDKEILVVEEVEPQELVVEESVPKPVLVTETKKVSDLFGFTRRLGVGSEGEDVVALKGFLQEAGYYEGERGAVFTEETRVALRNALIGECNWPESTRGIMGPQAQACIDNLEVTRIREVIASEQEAVALENLDITEEIQEDQTEVLVEDNDSSGRFTTELVVGSTGAEVSELQAILGRLGYLGSEPDGNFDITTSIALKSALIGQCGFEDDISGDLDERAIRCINSLELE